MASESLVLQRAIGDLVRTIDPDSVAISLYTKGLISVEDRDRAINTHKERSKRAAALIIAVQTLVETAPSKLSEFVSVLRGGSPAEKILAANITQGKYGPYTANMEPSSEDVDVTTRKRQPHLSASSEKVSTHPHTVRRDHTVHQQQDRSVLRDVLQCVLFIGGMSLVMWIGFMVVYNPLQPKDVPREKVTTTGSPSSGRDCHKILSSAEVYWMLKDKVDINEFGRCLGFSETDLENISSDSQRKSANILSAIIDKWFKQTTPPACWETIFDAIKCIPNHPLAKQVEKKYITQQPV